MGISVNACWMAGADSAGRRVCFFAVSFYKAELISDDKGCYDERLDQSRVGGLIEKIDLNS